MNGTCTSCAHAAMRDRRDAKRDETLREMAHAGSINCTKSPFRATFYPFNHACPSWEQADDKTIAARERWLEKTKVNQ